MRKAPEKPPTMSNTLEQIKEATKSLTNRDVNRLVNQRNPNTNADEVRIFIVIILAITTGFCAYTGFLFYKETFGKSFGGATAFVFAISLAAVVELAKVMLGTRVLRSVFFGWAFKDLWNTGYWLFAGLLFVGSFIWSVNISTDGMQLLTRSRSAERDTSAMSIAITDATRDIDRQITDAKKMQGEAMATKWKGTTTWAATQLAKEQGKTITGLNSQREQIVAKTMENWQDNKKQTGQRLDLFAQWVKDYGGFSELACFLALLALAFNDRRLVSENVKLEQQEQRAPVQQNGHVFTSPSPGPIAPSRPITFNETSQRATFFTRGPDGNVRPAPVDEPPGK